MSEGGGDTTHLQEFAYSGYPTMSMFFLVFSVGATAAVCMAAKEGRKTLDGTSGTVAMVLMVRIGYIWVFFLGVFRVRVWDMMAVSMRPASDFLWTLPAGTLGLPNLGGRLYAFQQLWSHLVHVCVSSPTEHLCLLESGLDCVGLFGCHSGLLSAVRQGEVGLVCGSLLTLFTLGTMPGLSTPLRKVL